MSEKNYTIRKARIEDAEQFVKLHCLVWRHAYKHIFPEEVFAKKEAKIPEKIKSWPNYHIHNDNVICYVAEIDNKLIGFMAGTYISEYEHYQDFADLNGLYIHPDYQHIGLGKEFFDTFVNEIKKKNINRFMLGVLKDNYQARKAYEKWGGKLDTTYTLPYENSGVKTEEVFYIYEV